MKILLNKTRDRLPVGRRFSHKKPARRNLFGGVAVDTVVAQITLPVAALVIRADAKSADSGDRSEPVYGGYANLRGDIFLFGKDGAYRVNLKNQVLQRRAPLNAGAQACYDATEAGEAFVYGNKTFRRLSHEQILGICACHRFRLTAPYGIGFS